MLERQHSQLIAGVHEMFKLRQEGSGWPEALLELKLQCEGQQPLTHQILEALGVLQCSPQDEAEASNGEWQKFEHHPLDDGVINDSSTPSPAVQTQPLKSFEYMGQPAVPSRPTSSQQSQPQIQSALFTGIEYGTAVPPVDLINIHSKQNPFFGANMAYFLEKHHPPLPDLLLKQPIYDETLGPGGNTRMNAEWGGIDDMFDGSTACVQPAKIPS